MEIDSYRSTLSIFTRASILPASRGTRQGPVSVVWTCVSVPVASKFYIKTCRRTVRYYWKLVVNVRPVRSMRWSCKGPFFRVYRSNTSLSLSQRRINGDLGNCCGLCCVGAVGRLWFGATLVLGEEQRTNIFHFSVAKYIKKFKYSIIHVALHCSKL